VFVILLFSFDSHQFPIVSDQCLYQGFSEIHESCVPFDESYFGSMDMVGGGGLFVR